MTFEPTEEDVDAAFEHYRSLLLDPHRTNSHVLKGILFDLSKGGRELYAHRNFWCRCGDAFYPAVAMTLLSDSIASRDDMLSAIEEVVDEAFNTPCALRHFDGTEPVTVTIDIPSGKIVFTDDMRPHFDCTLSPEPDINGLVGRLALMGNMAEQGVAYATVLNTSPNIYRTPEGVLVLANPGYSEDDDEIIPEGWAKVGGISTGLWAYHATDYDRYVAAGGGFGNNITVVEVEPGSYQFVNMVEMDDFDFHGDGDPERDGLLVFAEVHRRT